MTTAHTAEAGGGGVAQGGGVRQGFAAFGVIAAGIVLVANGTLQLLEGITAIAADDLIVVGQQYTYQWNTTGWGWVHVVIGALVIIGGFALMTGATWARILAVVLATVAIIANFLWLPYYPWWSLILIALYLYVIWAVANWTPRETP
ncbi:hypothetical protein [Tomitella fengzijianii]|uniref:DUF7144 domain-containing protein n=1 Tax=Tomitella fengzijianii TaxID=2597660 RepID=A0A516X685_9ACTN|nr:hypothetical protein [Tomitella fengzijianii]QDQ98584.1 hypothetical protein FO059_16215 [Tomitella fengzijianii]